MDKLANISWQRDTYNELIFEYDPHREDAEFKELDDSDENLPTSKSNKNKAYSDRTLLMETWVERSHVSVSNDSVRNSPAEESSWQGNYEKLDSTHEDLWNTAYDIQPRYSDDHDVLMELHKRKTKQTVKKPTADQIARTPGGISHDTVSKDNGVPGGKEELIQETTKPGGGQNQIQLVEPLIMPSPKNKNRPSVTRDNESKKSPTTSANRKEKNAKVGLFSRTPREIDRRPSSKANKELKQNHDKSTKDAHQENKTQSASSSNFRKKSVPDVSQASKKRALYEILPSWRQKRDTGNKQPTSESVNNQKPSSKDAASSVHGNIFTHIGNEQEDQGVEDAQKTEKKATEEVSPFRRLAQTAIGQLSFKGAKDQKPSQRNMINDTTKKGVDEFSTKGDVTGGPPSKTVHEVIHPSKRDADKTFPPATSSSVTKKSVTDVSEATNERATHKILPQRRSKRDTENKRPTSKSVKDQKPSQKDRINKVTEKGADEFSTKGLVTEESKRGPPSKTVHEVIYPNKRDADKTSPPATSSSVTKKSVTDVSEGTNERATHKILPQWRSKRDTENKRLTPKSVKDQKPDAERTTPLASSSVHGNTSTYIGKEQEDQGVEDAQKTEKRSTYRVGEEIEKKATEEVSPFRRLAQTAIGRLSFKSAKDQQPSQRDMINGTTKKGVDEISTKGVVTEGPPSKNLHGVIYPSKRDADKTSPPATSSSVTKKSVTDVSEATNERATHKILPQWLSKRDTENKRPTSNSVNGIQERNSDETHLRRPTQENQQPIISKDLQPSEDVSSKYDSTSSSDSSSSDTTISTVSNINKESDAGRASPPKTVNDTYPSQTEEERTLTEKRMDGKDADGSRPSRQPSKENIHDTHSSQRDPEKTYPLGYSPGFKAKTISDKEIAEKGTNELSATNRATRDIERRPSSKGIKDMHPSQREVARKSMNISETGKRAEEKDSDARYLRRPIQESERRSTMSRENNTREFPQESIQPTVELLRQDELKGQLKKDNESDERSVYLSAIDYTQPEGANQRSVTRDQEEQDRTEQTGIGLIGLVGVAQMRSSNMSAVSRRRSEGKDVPEHGGKQKMHSPTASESFQDRPRGTRSSEKNYPSQAVEYKIIDNIVKEDDGPRPGADLGTGCRCQVERTPHRSSLKRDVQKQISEDQQFLSQMNGSGSVVTGQKREVVRKLTEEVEDKRSSLGGTLGEDQIKTRRYPTETDSTKLTKVKSPKQESAHSLILNKSEKDRDTAEHLDRIENRIRAFKADRSIDTLKLLREQSKKRQSQELFPDHSLRVPLENYENTKIREHEAKSGEKVPKQTKEVPKIRVECEKVQVSGEFNRSTQPQDILTSLRALHKKVIIEGKKCDKSESQVPDTSQQLSLLKLKEKLKTGQDQNKYLSADNGYRLFLTDLRRGSHQARLLIKQETEPRDVNKPSEKQKVKLSVAIKMNNPHRQVRPTKSTDKPYSVGTKVSKKFKVKLKVIMGSGTSEKNVPTKAILESREKSGETPTRIQRSGLTATAARTNYPTDMPQWPQVEYRQRIRDEVTVRKRPQKKGRVQVALKVGPPLPKIWDYLRQKADPD